MSSRQISSSTNSPIPPQRSNANTPASPNGKSFFKNLAVQPNNFLTNSTHWSPFASLFLFFTGAWAVVPDFLKDWLALVNEGVNVSMQLFGKPYKGMIAAAADATEYIAILGNASDELHNNGWLPSLTYILSAALLFVVAPSRGIPWLFNQAPKIVFPNLPNWKAKGVGFLTAMLGISVLEHLGTFFLKKIKPKFDGFLMNLLRLPGKKNQAPPDQEKGPRSKQA